MKISAHKFYIPLFVVVVLLQLYLPSFKANIFIQLAALLLCCFIGNISFSRKFLAQLLPFVFILLIGFAGTLIHKYEVYNIIKDIFHFIKPLVGILLGYIIFKKTDDFRLFVKTIVIAGLISAFIHFYIIFFINNYRLGSIAELRNFTKDNFLDLFALFFLVYYRRFEGSYILKSRLYNYLGIAILALSSILYFSRTMILMAIILAVSVAGYTRITTRTIKIMGLFALSVVALYSYLYNANIKRGSHGVEGFLYKVKIAPEEVLKTNINRENHRDMWDHWRGYEVNRALVLMEESPSSFIFGTGHGSLVDLKFFAPLTGEPKGIRYISELHNGYMYILYKTGFVGLLAYLFILFRWYGYIYKRKNLKTVLVSSIGLIFLMSSITITGTYNTRDIIIFILGGALHFLTAVPAKDEEQDTDYAT